MDQVDIKLFQLIVRHKSISKAAQTLFLSQSAASQRLQTLEEELQVKLIMRKKGLREVELTDEGIKFMILSEKWITLYREMMNLKNIDTALSLRIASPNSLNNYLYTSLFSEISNNEPQLRLFIETHHSAEIYNLLDNKEIDLGFAFYSAKYKNIITKLVFAEKMYMVCPRGGKWKNKVVNPNDLDPKNELFTTWSPAIEQWHNIWWNPSINRHIEADTPNLLFNFMDKVDYWALCPASVIKMFHLSDKIEIHEFSESPPPRECFMLSHKYQSERESKAIQIFHKHFDSFLHKLQTEFEITTNGI